MSPRLKRQSEWFLVEAAKFAKDENLREIDLMVVPSAKSFGLNNSSHYAADIELVARAWQDAGLGSFRQIDHGIMVRPNFSFRETGYKLAPRTEKKLPRRPLKHRFTGVNWSAISAVAAIVAAAAAAFAAYFSYLALPGR